VNQQRPPTKKYRRIPAEQRVNDENKSAKALPMDVFPNSTLLQHDQVSRSCCCKATFRWRHHRCENSNSSANSSRIFRSALHVQRHQRCAKVPETRDTGGGDERSMTRRGLRGLAFWHNEHESKSRNKSTERAVDANGLNPPFKTWNVLKAQKWQQWVAFTAAMCFLRSLWRAAKPAVVDGPETPGPTSWPEVL